LTSELCEVFVSGEESILNSVFGIG